MANKNIFNTQKNTNSPTIAKGMTLNAAGGNAFSLENREALAQLSITGCVGDTFYVSADKQTEQSLELCKKIAEEKDGLEFIAKLAIYSRQKGYMKDMPSFLLSFLSIQKDKSFYIKAFKQTVDNSKIIQNHIQMIRSGFFGVKSMPNEMRRMIKSWIKSCSPEKLFRNDIGSPSMGDIIKMVHPKPNNKAEEAIYSYLINKSVDGKRHKASGDDLPELIKHYEAFKKDITLEIPKVSFEMLTALNLNDSHWKEIAKNASWTQTRMNLNTFERHNVFQDNEIKNMICERLSSKEEVLKSKVFPYQIMSSYINNTINDKQINSALEQAMEYSLKNVPELDGETYVFVDVSGSMNTPITGVRKNEKGKTITVSKIRNIDVAGLIASAIKSKNKSATVLAFDTSLKPEFKYSKVMEYTTKFSSIRGGGTDCSLGFKMLADKNKKVSNVIIISDNESWSGYNSNMTTGSSKHWKEIVKNNPDVKLVCIDISPNTTTQVKTDKNVLNIGGFSDIIFNVMDQFFKYGKYSSNFIQYIDNDIVL